MGTEQPWRVFKLDESRRLDQASAFASDRGHSGGTGEAYLEQWKNLKKLAGTRASGSRHERTIEYLPYLEQ